jgi:hypothetical protein
MNISDIRTRIDAERSCLVTRTAEADDTPVLTLVETAEPNHAESPEKADPLIQALVDKLPKPNAIWSIGLSGSRLRRWHSISSTRPAKVNHRSAANTCERHDNFEIRRLMAHTSPTQGPVSLTYL